MQSVQLFSCITLLLLYCNVSISAFLCELNEANPFKVAFTTTVDVAGRHGNFTTIQSAIDSIPSGNTKWIRIQIFAGVYREKVTITYDKTCIFLDGAGRHNTYNIGLYSPKLKRSRPALAAEILGDKAAFYNCSISGCKIPCGMPQAAITFTNATSKQSVVHYSLGTYGDGTYVGHITAQGRDSADDHSGFVFKDCEILGKEKLTLGELGELFPECSSPAGLGCLVQRADTSHRVPWLKKLSAADLDQFLSVDRFINHEGWIANLPTIV
ncbi:putative pectinesterase 66 [Quercus suber]|uniref:pectinesterase n=1 Tax=Quercus suber TaxID=58331 RepID=A0AAW0JM88_QUESU